MGSESEVRNIMLSIPTTGGRGSGFTALQVGGRLLIQDAERIVAGFDGVLAVPTPHPSPEKCSEVRYALTAEDGTDLLDAAAPVATDISDQDKERLSACYARLKAGARQNREGAAVLAFRLPDPSVEPELYRECIDPESGTKRLVVLWGIAKTDAKGRFLATGPPVPWAMPFGAAPSAAAGPASAGRLQPGQAMPAAYGAAWYGGAAAPTTRCRWWALAIILLLALGAAAGGAYWWAEHHRRQDEGDKPFATLDDQITDVRGEIQKFGEEVGSLRQQADARARDRKALDTMAGDPAQLDSLAGDIEALKKQVEAIRKGTQTQSQGLRDGLQSAIGKLDTTLDGKLALIRKGFQATVEDDALARIETLRAAIADRLALLSRALLADAGNPKLLALINALGTATAQELALVRKGLDPEADQAALTRIDELGKSVEATLTLLRKDLAAKAPREDLLARVNALRSVVEKELTLIRQDLQPKAARGVVATVEELRQFTEKQFGLIRDDLARKADKDVLARVQDLRKVTEDKLTLLRKSIAAKAGGKVLLAGIDDLSKATEARLALIRKELRTDVDKDVLARLDELSKSTEAKLTLLRQAVAAKVGDAQLLARIDQLAKVSEDKLALVRKDIEAQASKDALAKLEELRKLTEQRLTPIKRELDSKAAGKHTLAKVGDQELLARLRKLGLGTTEVPDELRGKVDKVLAKLRDLSLSHDDIRKELLKLKETDAKVWNEIRKLASYHTKQPHKPQPGGQTEKPTGGGQTHDTPKKDSATFFGLEATGNSFVYVVDRSGSMAGRKLTAAKAELIRSISALRATTKFNVVFYNQNYFLPPGIPSGHLTTFPATVANKARIIAWVQSIGPSGGTDPTQAMAYALNLKPDAVWLLSDGIFSPKVADFIQRVNAGRRTQVHTIAFGSKVGEPVLTRIARENRGRYRHVPVGLGGLLPF